MMINVNTIKFLLLSLLCFGYIEQGKTQQVTYTGTILDAETQAPLPYAHILLGESRKGTFSNEEGYFRISLPEGHSYTYVKISATSFQTTKVPLTELKDKIITLAPYVVELSTVEIRPVNMREYVWEAIRRIPENHFGDPLMLKGFFRTQTKIDQQNAGYVEALLDIIDQPTQDTLKQNQYRVLMARDLSDSVTLDWGLDEDMDSMNFEAFTPHDLLTSDIIRKEGMQLDEDMEGRIVSFLDTTKLDYYHFEYKGLTYYQGRTVMEIHFKPRWKMNLGMFEGTILLDEQNYAFASLDFEIPKRYLKHVLPFGRGLGKLAVRGAMRLAGISLNYSLDKVQAHYSYQHLNNKWYPKYIGNDFRFYVKVRYRKEGININNHFALSNELFILDANPTDLPEIPEEERFYPSQKIKDVLTEHSEDEWQKYNIVTRRQSVVGMKNEE
ncbi:carboxypeptidase-like regulatory domain-containing protein [Algivirga pacifica]|uniref:CarboxypepD_reg-like domain-containing protein n=1 Tax=Algivirga pacifica TaxID=1162670 RepID=A0ABP9D4G1_9BACT